jgi:hypothetical protein
LRAAVTDTRLLILSEREHAVTCLADALRMAEEQYLFARLDAAVYRRCSVLAEGARGFLASATAEMSQFLTDVGGLVLPAVTRKESLLAPGGQVLSERILDRTRDFPRYYKLEDTAVNARSEAKRFQGRYVPGTMRAVYIFWLRDRLPGLRPALQTWCERRFIEDWIARPRNEDVLRHPQMVARNKRDLAEKLVRRALPWASLGLQAGAQTVDVMRGAYLGLGDPNDPDTSLFRDEVVNLLIARGYDRNRVQVHPTGNKSVIYLNTYSYSFPLPAIEFVSGTCRAAYNEFVDKLRHGERLTEQKFLIPTHLDQRWEGEFEELYVMGDEEAGQTRDALHVLLFGALLQIVFRKRNEQAVLVYGYTRVDGLQERPCLWGTRRASLEELKAKEDLRRRLLKVIEDREKQLSTEQRVAYCYAISYLMNLPEYRLETEQRMLGGKATEVLASLGASRPQALPDLPIEGLRGWLKARTDSVLDWTDEEFPTLRVDKWVDSSN